MHTKWTAPFNHSPCHCVDRRRCFRCRFSAESCRLRVCRWHQFVHRQHYENDGCNTWAINMYCVNSHFHADLSLTISPLWHVLLLLQQLVEDVAVATSSRHANLSWARRFAVASPRFIGRRSASMVLSQDCLGRQALRLQSPGGSIMQAWRARWWCCQGSARWRCPKNDRRPLRTVSDRSGCPVRERISSFVTNSDECIFRMRLRHQLSIAASA